MAMHACRVVRASRGPLQFYGSYRIRELGPFQYRGPACLPAEVGFIGGALLLCAIHSTNLHALPLAYNFMVWPIPHKILGIPQNYRARARARAINHILGEGPLFILLRGLSFYGPPKQIIVRAYHFLGSSECPGL